MAFDRTHNMPDRTAETLAPQAAGKAFTLIELMVVIFIIGILVVLVVGVSRYVYDEAARRETETVQQTVMTAIEAYRNVTDGYPGDDPSAAAITDPSVDTPMKALIYYMQALHLVVTNPQADAIKEACGPIILKLPRDAYTGTTVNDGFGNEMEYDVDGGLGGRPVLISAGPDSNLGNEDDIRSDR